jgi:pilus assembly protein FimV
VAAAPPPVAATPPVAAAPPPAAATPPATVAPPVTVPPPVAAAPPPVTAEPAASIPPPAAPPTAASGTAAKPAPPADTGSWIDWVTANWWVVLAVLALILGLLGFAAMRRRSQEQDTDLGRLMENTGVAESRETTAKLSTPRKAAESFVVEESGEHAAPDFGSASRFAEAELKSPDDTLSGEAAVNLDQGDPLAEADFHMAYGLYDQAADLVRMALEREPDRRDLRLKLLEIYFVWGNKEAFLQTAKSLEATRDRAPAGEWDKVVIMGRQICPEAPLFAATGSGRGAGAVVDLNLEGGENRVDIDLFGDPEGERSTLDPQLAETGEHASPTRESPALHGASAPLDFTLDAPERGADVSQTREMPARDEPTVESELMDFGNPDLVDAPFYAAPAEPPAIDDLGLDLDHMETQTALDHPDHAGDAPTVVAGIDEHARRMMADADGIPRDGTAENTGLNARDRDLTELERELEASFVAQLDVGHDHKTAVLGPESAPTVLMPREFDGSPTTRFRTAEMGNFNDLDKLDMESTSKLRGISAENIPAESISADSIDLDLDRLASALGSGDTLEQPRSAEDLFSSDVFDATERTSKNKAVDLDVGEAMFSTETPTNKLQVQTNKLMPVEFGAQDLEPVTMSEVGTKLDLARAYMDMGDPEGARSILEEVVAEGSASQQQEASRLIESLPG